MPQRRRIDTGGGVNAGPPLVEPIRILNERAKLPKTAVGLERRKIVQFDAWTDPRILKCLEENKGELSDDARDLFCKHQPEIDPTVLRCAFELFTRIPLDRARKIAAGQEYGVKARVEGRAELLLEAIRFQLDTTKKVVQGRAVGELLPLLIRRIANYLHTIFNVHVSSGATPSPKLDAMFANFASGALRIEDRGPQEFMNAEPDGAFFFAFSEFCIQAAHFSVNPGRPWWLSLGGLFVALQDVFCVRYHRTGGERRFSEYRDIFFNDKRKMDVEVLLKHVASVRHRCGTVGKLVEQASWNAFWYFFDDVQHLKDVPKPAESAPRRPTARSTRNGPQLVRA
jgi:hypothetical protein